MSWLPPEYYFKFWMIWLSIMAAMGLLIVGLLLYITFKIK